MEAIAAALAQVSTLQIKYRTISKLNHVLDVPKTIQWCPIELRMSLGNDKTPTCPYHPPSIPPFWWKEGSKMGHSHFFMKRSQFYRTLSYKAHGKE